VNKEELDYVESGQRQHHEVLEHQNRMCAIAQNADYALFALLKPSLTKDGDQWCVLYGENIIEGIVGFGDTPQSAIINWNAEWNKTGDKLK